MNINWDNVMEALYMLLDRFIDNFGGITIIVLMLTIAYMIYSSHKGNKLDLTDLIKAKGTNSLSLTKFLQLVGGLTGTWMVVYMTLHNRLSYDILLVYLAYVGAIDGWSKYVSARFGVTAPIMDKTVPPVKDDTESKD